MTETAIYGASDDLIEIEGVISEEFNHYDESPALLAFSDGTLLEIEYDDDGIWRIRPLATGSCKFEHRGGSAIYDRPDVAVLTGDLKWCVYAKRQGQINPAFVRKSSAGKAA